MSELRYYIVRVDLEEAFQSIVRRRKAMLGSRSIYDAALVRSDSCLGDLATILAKRPGRQELDRTGNPRGGSYATDPLPRTGGSDARCHHFYMHEGSSEIIASM